MCVRSKSCFMKRTRTTFKIVISLVLVLTFCYILFVKNTKINVTKNLIQYIENECHNIEPCSIRMTDFTPFDWDQMLYIENGAIIDENSHIVNVTLPKKYSFLDGKIVFSKNSKLVHFEEIQTGVEYFRNKEIKFDLHRYVDGEQYKIYNITDAIFNVKIYSFIVEHNQKRLFYNLESKKPLRIGENIIEINGDKASH